MPDYSESFFPIEGVNVPLAPDNYVMADTIPNYLLMPSPGYGVTSVPTYTTIPDTSSGFFGGVADFFTNTVPSAMKNSTNSIGDWFTPPNVAKTAGATTAGAGLLNAVSGFFKGGNNQKNKASRSNTPQAQGLGVGGALLALLGLTPPPPGQQSITQAAGDGLGNIVGGLTKPLLPVLILVVVGGIVYFLILGRMSRVAG
jgi:hypothetical protein